MSKIEDETGSQLSNRVLIPPKANESNANRTDLVPSCRIHLAQYNRIRGHP